MSSRVTNATGKWNVKKFILYEFHKLNYYNYDLYRFIFKGK